MAQHYSATTGEFYDSQVHQTLPDDAVEITTPMLALLTAIARKAQIGDPGARLATQKYVDDAVQKYAGLRHMQVFDKNGKFTVPEDCTRIRIRLWGGGGGGSGAVNSGSVSGFGGGYAEGFFTVAPETVLAITVGAGGMAGMPVNGASGRKGGTSAVGALISATGGDGGTITSPGMGGVGQGGDWQVSGSDWQGMHNNLGGMGGGAYGSSGGHGNFLAGAPGMTPGGGGGSGGSGYPGGAGGAGLVIIEY